MKHAESPVAASAPAATAPPPKKRAANQLPPRGQSTARKPVGAPKPAAEAKPAAKAKPEAGAKSAAAARPPAKPAPAAKKALRPKLVRDGFTMPEADFALIAELKARALGARRAAKKSELLRAGLHALAALDASALAAALDRLDPVRIGRPKKGR